MKQFLTPLFRWSKKAIVVDDQKKSEAAIARVTKSLNHETTKPKASLWVVFAEQRDTYQSKLHIWAEGARIFVVASCELCIERDLVTRELALFLLEENCRIQEATYQLVAVREKSMVALSRIVDSRGLKDAELQRIITWTLETFQLMVCKAFAMGLIIEGPHEYISKKVSS